MKIGTFRQILSALAMLTFIPILVYGFEDNGDIVEKLIIIGYTILAIQLLSFSVKC